MRYLFPVLLLAAAILLCVCAAPSVVSTLYPPVYVSGCVQLPAHAQSVSDRRQPLEENANSNHFLVISH